MKGFNKVILAGNVGRDPEIQSFDGRKRATFSLATTDRYRDRDGLIKENTEWHNIVVWGNLVEIVEGFVRKGSPLLVEGRIRYREYDDKDNVRRRITEILVDSLILLGNKQDGATAMAQAENYGKSTNDDISAQNDQLLEDFGSEDDDLPF
ncbi:MAG: single-stranded DNA-binding protein [Bacteroidales bacterium]|nr:single-stranded DNA-binding protein [Bacteroidales bacterium]